MYDTVRSDKRYKAGRHSVYCHRFFKPDPGERVASGIYFHQLQADNMSLMQKMLMGWVSLFQFALF